MTNATYTPNGATVAVLEPHRWRNLGWGRGTVEEVHIDAGHGPVWCPLDLLDPTPASMHEGSKEE